MQENNNRYAALEEKIKKENLYPDPRNLGEFIAEKKDDDGIRYLSPENWVFHPDVVKKVIEGKYNKIKPYSAEFDATLNCSNRCTKCAYKYTKNCEHCRFVWIRNNFSNPEVHMQSFDFAKNLLDKLIDGGIKGVIFTGGGEPFLFKGLEELVAHATERSIDSVNYTNGNCVSRERIERLIEAQPLLVRVSLNAGTEEIYNKFHNPLDEDGAFERCLKTIEYLAQGSILNPRMSVGVGIVINKINQNDLVESAKRVREITEKTGGGIEFITYRPEFDYYDNEQLPEDLLKKTYDIVEQDVRRVLEGTKIRLSNVTCRYEALMQDTRTYKECRGTGLYAELAPNGNLYFCCDRHFNEEYLIGDLKQDSLFDIHFGKQRLRVLNFINENKCGVCPPACKSHEINKQFQKIEELRAKNELYKVELWIKELQKRPVPKMVNF